MMGTIDRGLVQVYTGDGKGKTTAAVGLAVRARGAGLRVAFVQFVKGGRRSSELQVLEDVGVLVERPAERSSGLMSGEATDEDRDAASAAWAIALELFSRPDYDLVILDEVIVAMAHHLVAESAVLAALGSRIASIEVVLTGRGASQALIDYADLVTEMVPLKHPFDAGVPARIGIEY